MTKRKRHRAIAPARGRTLCTLALGLALATACATAMAQDKAQWLRSVEAANDLSLQCFGENNDADCQAMIRHYDAAMAAADADEGVRHELFKYRMNAIAARGGNLLEAGHIAQALSVLHAGHAEMLVHLDGGKHAHTVIDNLSLQGHFLHALVASGDLANADTVASLPRQVAPTYYAAREQSRDNERTMALVSMAVVRSEALETRYGDALLARAEALDAADPRASTARAAAIEAYRNALSWLQRGDAEGWALAFEATNPIRFAKLNNALGKALLASGDRDGAMQAHNLAFAAARCKGFDDGSLHDFDKVAAAAPCNQAVSGYMLASGDLQRQAAELSDAMYRQQMELYGTDIDKLLQMAPQAD